MQPMHRKGEGGGAVLGLWLLCQRWTSPEHGLLSGSLLECRGCDCSFKQHRDPFQGGVVQVRRTGVASDSWTEDELDKLREDPIIQELGPDFYELMPGSFEVIELPMQHLPEVRPSVESQG